MEEARDESVERAQTVRDDNSSRIRRAGADSRMKRAHNLTSLLPFYWASLISREQAALVLSNEGDCVLIDDNCKINSKGINVPFYVLCVKTKLQIEQHTVECTANELLISAGKIKLTKWIEKNRLKGAERMAVWEKNQICPWPVEAARPPISHLFEFGKMDIAQLRMPSGAYLPVISVSTTDLKPEEREIVIADMKRSIGLGGRHILSLWGTSISPDQLTVFIENVTGAGQLVDVLGKIDINQLNSFARQICSGLLYLEQNDVIHRKLSLDVCLLAKPDTVKIALFCLSTGLYPKNMYTDDTERCRWIPWECLEGNGSGYGNKGMVWSFGTMVWSMYHAGALPFENESSAKIKSQEFRKTAVLPCVEQLLPSGVVEVIELCWLEKEHRPDFIHLQVLLNTKI